MSDTASGSDDAFRRVHFVDLVLGAWRPREAASQLALSLGVTLEPLAASSPDAGALARFRDLIDVEADGDPVVMQAWRDASALAPAIAADSTVGLLAPRYGLPLRTANEWFFLFLRRLGATVAVIGDEPSFGIGKMAFDRRQVPAPGSTSRPWLPVEQLRLLRFFPGLLPKAVAEAAKINPADAELIATGPDRFLVPAAYRDRDPAQSPRELDALEEIENLDDGLLALTQTFCTAWFADSRRLAGLAGAGALAHDADLAAQLIARSRAVARDAGEAAHADLARRGMWLAERRFREIVVSAPPSLKSPAGVRGELARLHTAAAVFGGETEEAEASLAPALGALKQGEPMAADDLLLLGALAEARVGKGDIGGGYFLAEVVGTALGRAADPEQRVIYRNALGLARIHRLRADEADYGVAVSHAYATSAGARSFHEILELNALLAAADPNRQSPAARAARLRAALAWLAIEPSEGLSRRAIEIVSGKPGNPRNQLDLDISDTLSDGIQAAWPGLPADRQRLPVVRAARPGVAPPAAMLAGAGVGALWSPSGESNPAYSRPRQRLIRLLLSALAMLAPRFADLGGGTLLVDGNLGLDIPSNREEALTVALRSGAKEFIFANETLHLDAALRPRLAGDLRVRLSPIVHRIFEESGRLIVRFRRRLRDRALSEKEMALVAMLPAAGKGPGMTLAAVAAAREEDLGLTETALRALEVAHVVRLDVAAR